MSDLRVDVKSIEEAYLTTPGSKELWNVTPVFDRKAKGSRRLVIADNAGPGANRVINGVIKLFEAKRSAEHRAAVEIFEHDLLWDGPPIRLSNKGHLRLATYLFKYFAHLSIYPVAVTLSEPSSGRHLLEVDAVAVSYPHRVWWLPLTLLLPAEVPKNVHFKIGVKGSLEDGKVELFTGRLTNWLPFVPQFVRVINGILMGAIPHAFEGALGYVFDFFDGGDFYARKRDAAFRARHPHSTNPTWDWIQDLAYDIPNWAKEQAIIGAETAQAAFGHWWTYINEAFSRVINFYLWLLNSAWAAVTTVTNTAADFLGSGTSADTTSATYSEPGTKGLAPGSNQVSTAGGGSKYYKGPVVTGVTQRPVATAGSAY